MIQPFDSNYHVLCDKECSWKATPREVCHLFHNYNTIFDILYKSLWLHDIVWRNNEFSRCNLVSLFRHLLESNRHLTEILKLIEFFKLIEGRRNIEGECAVENDGKILNNLSLILYWLWKQYVTLKFFFLLVLFLLLYIMNGM